jgi:hypothetical protein
MEAAGKASVLTAVALAGAAVGAAIPAAVAGRETPLRPGPRATATTAAALVAADGQGGGLAAAKPPVVQQMVVFRSGRAVISRVSTRGLRVRVGRRRCAVAGGTALAALLRDPPARVRLRDFGACSRRPQDGGQLFVSAIGADVNRGNHGWVYKVGRRAATAGAANPTGPFGRGRLRAGQRITWFYCRLVQGGCQRSLELKAAPEPGGVAVTVRGHDDEGRGVRVAGATVRLGSVEQVTDTAGVARFAVDPGTYSAFAEKAGLVRSYTERVVVR